MPDIIIVLDFDGVILESTDVKSKAFRVLFSEFPAHLNEIVAYHEANLGISRFEKFRHIYRNVLGIPLDTQEERRLGERFSELVVEEVMRCPFVPGALEFIRNNAHMFRLYIASGTPEDELHGLVAARGLTANFNGIYGSPRRKDQIIESIVTRTGVPRSSVLFIGDGRTDLEAAQRTRIGFIGRARCGGRNPFEGLNVPVVADLFGLERYVVGTRGVLRR